MSHSAKGKGKAHGPIRDLAGEAGYSLRQTEHDHFRPGLARGDQSDLDWDENVADSEGDCALPGISAQVLQRDRDLQPIGSRSAQREVGLEQRANRVLARFHYVRPGQKRFARLVEADLERL